MNFNLKNYKAFKTSAFLRDNKYIVICLCSNFNYEDWTKIERELHKSNLKYHRLLNKVSINLLRKSIFKNYTFLINGPILLLAVKNKKDINIEQCLKFNSKISFLCLKVKSKIYVNSQLAENKFSLKNKNKYTKSLNSLQLSFFSFYKNLCLYTQLKKTENKID